MLGVQSSETDLKKLLYLSLGAQRAYITLWSEVISCDIK